MIIFNSKKNRNDSGYGDRLVGMSAVRTIARILECEFTSVWDDEYARLCDGLATALPSSYEEVNLFNQRTSDVLSQADLRALWEGKTIVISSNTPIDLSLWSNPFLSSELQGRSYELESIRSYREIFRDHIRLKEVPTETFQCGIQIRCGDAYCYPGPTARTYIPESEFPALCTEIKSYLERRSIRGRVFVTSDTYKILDCFRDLNDSVHTFVFRDRSDDIHFASDSAAHRLNEIVHDHMCLQNCDLILTSLRSNFGTTAAYCSSRCKELVLYSPSWQFESYACNDKLLLKKYKNNVRAE